MGKEYRIQSEKIKTMVNYEVKRMSIVLLFVLIFVSIFPLIAVFKEHEPIYLISVPAIFCIILFSGMLLSISKFKKIYWENYRIIVTSDGIRKIIDMDNVKSILGEIGWRRSSLVFKQNDLLIRWKKIKKIKDINNGFIVMGNLGYGKIFIPKFLQDYDEVKNTIYNYKNNGQHING